MDEDAVTRGVKRKLLFSPASSPAPSPILKQKHPYLANKNRNNGVGDTMRLKKGQAVYVYSEDEAWKEAVVREVDSQEDLVTVAMMEDSEQVTSFHVDDVLFCWENDAIEVNNLTHVNPVHEATILSCLHKRFEVGIYYTNAGNTVVAVNPYKDVSHLYTMEQIQAYHSREQGLLPHIYPVAENAYISLVRELGHVNQSIVISGESGAGKTVSAKHLLRYLTIIANPVIESWSLDDKGFQIEQRVVDSNPILEAFGNAATTRNDNSSRFGKFIQLQFLRSGQIQGGAIETYLLEKTRVMHQGERENNFHVFYQMTGLRAEPSDPDWMRDLQAEMADTTFVCVPCNQDCSENAELRETLDAMSRIGLSNDSQKDIFQILLAILYLGNLVFVNVSDDSSDLDGSLMSDQALEKSGQLLGLNPEHLKQTLLHRSLQAGGRRQSLCVKRISIAEARSRRDILAMLVYSRLFEWLVGFINSRIKAEVFDNVIGLLDIYGFEIFPTNSLEQLCINYANERLQQHYVAQFLKNLQMEYQEECLHWEPIDYNDNRPCVNLLDGRFSVFGLLNEEVYLNRKSDVEGLRDRLLQLSGQSQNCRRSPRLSRDRHSPSFLVQHYAGEVSYSVSDLVPKNKDDIPADLVSLLMASDNPFVHQLFASYTEPESPTGRKKKTVLTKFKSSLDNLMSSIEQSDVHYIRCLRPNMTNVPGVFQDPYVLQQLRACGTIESVNICRKGYPARMPYWSFMQRYSLVLRPEYRLVVDAGDCVDGGGGDKDDDGEEKEDVCDPLDTLLQQQLDFPVSPPATPTPRKKQRLRSGVTRQDQVRRVCFTILRSMSSSEEVDMQRQFGRSKLFLTEQQLEELECARLAVLHHSATCLQSAWRALVCRRHYTQLLAARTIHRAWTVHRARQRFLRLRQAATVFQRAWVAVRTRRDFLALKQAAILVQRAWAVVRTRRDFLTVKWAAMVIQRAWMTLKTRRNFVAMKQAAMVIQRAWMTLKTRRNFVAMKQAAMVIQRACVMLRTRRDFLAMKQAAVVIQRAWVVVKTRRDFLAMNQAAVVIQRAWVVVRTRRDFLAVKRAAVVIQRAWVTVKIRRDFIALRRAAMVVQGARRAELTRRCYVRVRQGAVAVQGAWRAVQLRRDFVGLRRASVVIQRAWLTRRTRGQFLRMREAAIILQRGAREWLQRSHDEHQDFGSKAKNVTLILQPLHPADDIPSALLQQPLKPAENRARTLHLLNPDEEGTAQQLDIALHRLDSSLQPVCPSLQGLPDLKEVAPDLQPVCPSSQDVSDSKEPVPACDGNLSDDSGVMVHEPVQVQRPAGRKGARLGRKEREALEVELQKWRKLAASLKAWPRLQGMHVGDGVVTRQRVPKSGVRFHTRASVLRYGHMINRRDLPSGLMDVLTELPSGGHTLGSSVDP
ncbi:unconventional myosin-XIX-like [Babylonia areolata]|uniref:unconventional myosin-XIX-like n=1 Tax=Babylonia areolata TaxID=304850 RepID=UPI003FD35D2E